MKPPILLDFPESFETERLLIRSPLFGDGPELHAAVTESMGELTPWMPWPKEHRTVDDSEASSRRARVAFLQRSELRLHLYLKGTDTLVGSSGLQGINWEVPKFEIGYWCAAGSRAAATLPRRCSASRPSLSTSSGPNASRSGATPATLPASGSPNAPASG